MRPTPWPCTLLGGAVDAMRLLKADDAGRAAIVVGGGSTFGSAGWPALPPHATYAVDLVGAPEHLRPALRTLLDKVAVVDGLAEARALVEQLPEVTAATRDGDLLGRTFAHGGSSATPSLLEVQAAVDDANEQLEATTHQCERLRFSLARVGEERERAQGPTLRLHWRDSMSLMRDWPLLLSSWVNSVRPHARLPRRLTVRRTPSKTYDCAMTGGHGRPDRVGAASGRRRDLLPISTNPQQRSVIGLPPASPRRGTRKPKARLAVRTGEERARALHGRADELEQGAQAVRSARERARRLRERALKQAEIARAVLRACDVVSGRLERSVALAAQTRAAAELARTEREGELLAVRGRGRELAGELETAH